MADNKTRQLFNRAVRRATTSNRLSAFMGKQTAASTWTFSVPGYPEWVYVTIGEGGQGTVIQAKNTAMLPLLGGMEIELDLDTEGQYSIVGQRKSFRRGHWKRVSTANVSNPPTDAQLDAEFGTPATVGAGFTASVNDNGAGTNYYSVESDGTNWWIFTGTKAT